MKLKSQKVPLSGCVEESEYIAVQVCKGFVKLCVKISLRQSKATTGIRKSRMHEVPPAAASTILGAL